MGLYDLGSATSLTKEQAADALPHIYMSDQDEILKKLETDAIEDDYRPIAVHTVPKNEDILLGTLGCERIDLEHNLRRKDPHTWAKAVEHLKPLIYEQIGKAFDVNPDTMDFVEAYEFADTIWTETFEGLTPRYNWTQVEWDNLYESQMIELIGCFSEEMIKAWVTRLFTPILNYMKEMIRPGSIAPEHLHYAKDLKYILYSMHDTQVTHFLHVMKPENIDPLFIPYASTIFFELHKLDTDECSISQDPLCYKVTIEYNGEPMKLSGCKKLDCGFVEFEAYMLQVLYDQAELEVECAKDPKFESESAWDNFVSLEQSIAENEETFYS
jgi:hypothetical protein